VGHKRKPAEHHTFAEIVEDVTAANPDPGPGGFVSMSTPISDGEYTDKHGVRWQLRGGELRWPRIQHLLLDHQVRVLHVYWDDIREVPDDNRADFLAVVRPYLKGTPDRPPGDFTDYVATEFKDDHHRSLPVIEEHC
jgi:hypothetical protein